MISTSLFAPFITDYDPLKVDLRMMLKPPSTDHILGTDKIGRMYSPESSTEVEFQS